MSSKTSKAIEKREAQLPGRIAEKKAAAKEAKAAEPEVKPA